MARFEPSADPVSTGRSPRAPFSPWLLVAIVVVATAVVAMLRYAIDLLAVVSVVWLFGLAFRKTGDWVGRGRSSGAASTFVITVLCIGGAALVMDWLFTTGVVSSRVSPYIPANVKRTAASAENRGWGQRVWFQTPSADEPPAQATPSPDSAPAEETAGTLDSSPAAPVLRALDHTITRIESSQSRATPGTRVQITATVTSQSGRRPRGSVTFLLNSVVVGSARVGGDARAAISIRRLPPGRHRIVAEFKGDSPFGHSSASLAQDVTEESPLAH